MGIKGTWIIGNILLFIQTQSPNLAVPQHKANVTCIGKHQWKPALQQSWQSQVTHNISTSCLLTKKPIICPNYVNTSAVESANTNILESGQRAALTGGNNLALKGMAKGARTLSAGKACVNHPENPPQIHRVSEGQAFEKSPSKKQAVSF